MLPIRINAGEQVLQGRVALLAIILSLAKSIFNIDAGPATSNPIWTLGGHARPPPHAAKSVSEQLWLTSGMQLSLRGGWIMRADGVSSGCWLDGGSVISAPTVAIARWHEG